VIEGPDVGIAHSEMKVYVNLDEDIDAHRPPACVAGAEIFREPEDQFYGGRLYDANDLEGHQWTFSRLIKSLSLEEMGHAGGVAARDHL
jgi:uncharacterized glyoxalase superfamily protein PhnB